MKPLQVLALLGLLSLAELGSTVLITRWLGPLHAYLLFAVLMATGLAMQWWRWHHEVRHIYASHEKIRKKIQQHRRDQIAAGQPVDRPSYLTRRSLVFGALTQYLAAFWLETFLLLLPGLITSGISSVLMVLFWNYERMVGGMTYKQARAEAIKNMEGQACKPSAGKTSKVAKPKRRRSKKP